MYYLAKRGTRNMKANQQRHQQYKSQSAKAQEVKKPISEGTRNIKVNQRRHKKYKNQSAKAQEI